MAQKDYTYHPMHMHLHAACDHGASMAMHMHNARQLGMRYIWFTDHDTRTGEKRNSVYGYTFDTPELFRQEPCGKFSGFRLLDEKIRWHIDQDAHTLFLQYNAAADLHWQGSGISFFSDGTRHTAPLAAGVSLEINLKEYVPTPDTRLIFDVTLSQRPPECNKAHLLYVLGNTEGLEAPHTQIRPLLCGASRILLALSADVSEDPAIGGQDNAFDTITVRLESRNSAIAKVALGDIRFFVEKHYEDAHQALKKTAAWVGQRYGITPFVSFEISGAGCHKNCFSTQVPTIDYRARHYAVTEQEAVAHVKAHGGIFAFNHPFAISELKHKVFTDAERLQILAAMQAELVASRARGAEMMEIGFPEGRNGFSGDEYLLLWDMLALSGLILTGYGSSDSHRDNVGWFSRNNFATWIGAPEALSHPIPEAVFTESMKKGRLYTGDPVKLQGPVNFQTKAGHPMGSVFLSDHQKTLTLLFTAENTQPDWQFRLIENGHVVYTETLAGNTFTHHSQLTTGHHAVNFQRAELREASGRCILVTNPIYLIDSQLFTGELPQHRILEEENI